MSIRDYIEHLKGKPERQRRQVALAASAGIASLVFLGWATMLVTSGTLALGTTREAEPAFTSAKGANSSIAGAAAALSSAFSGEGELKAVESNVSSTMDQQDTGEATVIPF
jgi:hypothetical protein